MSTAVAENEQRIGIRQGDVILVKCYKPTVIPNKLSHLTLAEGEVTGHAHRMSGGVCTLYGESDDQPKYLLVEEESTLTHEEHGEHVVDTGWYDVIKQREYEPNGWRNVAD